MRFNTSTEKTVKIHSVLLDYYYTRDRITTGSESWWWWWSVVFVAVRTTGRKRKSLTERESEVRCA